MKLGLDQQLPPRHSVIKIDQYTEPRRLITRLKLANYMKTKQCRSSEKQDGQPRVRHAGLHAGKQNGIADQYWRSLKTLITGVQQQLIMQSVT